MYPVDFTTSQYLIFTTLILGFMMSHVDLSNEPAFLEYCNAIDLSAYNGAIFMVGPEVTGVIHET